MGGIQGGRAAGQLSKFHLGHAPTNLLFRSRHRAQRGGGVLSLVCIPTPHPSEVFRAPPPGEWEGRGARGTRQQDSPHCPSAGQHQPQTSALRARRKWFFRCLLGLRWAGQGAGHSPQDSLLCDLGFSGNTHPFLCLQSGLHDPERWGTFPNLRPGHCRAQCWALGVGSLSCVLGLQCLGNPGPASPDGGVVKVS